MKVDDALSGQAGLSGLRWLLAGSASRRVLRVELAALLGDGSALGRCHLRVARFRPGRRLRAYFDVGLGTSGQHASPRPVAVSWRPSRKFSEAKGVDEPEADALHRGWAAPFKALHAERPSWGMRLLVAPLDPDLPELGPLSDACYAGEVLFGSRRAGFILTVLRYFPGRRHVLRYDPTRTASPTPGTVFLKVYPDDAPRRILHVTESAAEWLASTGKMHVVVRPSAVPAHDSALAYPRAEGVPLSRLLFRSTANPAEALRETGRLLRTLQQIPLEELKGLQPHGLSDELRVIARTGQHIAPLCPPAGRVFGSLLDRAEYFYAQLPREPHTLAHGDFKAEHLFVHGSKLSLLDFDGCRLADPAFDAGKMLADMQWWYATRGRSGLTDAQDAFLDGYLRGSGRDRIARARLWEALFLAKITARRANRFNRHWSLVTRELMTRAEAVLRGAEKEFS
jgi:aminoglycoside phosphotransferase (APT) family kinase protein